MRSYHDTTSACNSCVYFSRPIFSPISEDVGYCGNVSLPIWAYDAGAVITADKQSNIVRADDTRCWHHTIRTDQR